MKHWSGLVYLVAGVIIGLLVGASLTGVAAGGDEPARADNHPDRYTLTQRSEGDYVGQYSVFDAQTGILYRFSWNDAEDGYGGTIVNAVEGWYEYLKIKRRAAEQPPSE